MQHTDRYQLNLVETSDTFSPAPLNENMEKVEAALETEAAARQSEDGALDRRVKVLEAHKTAWGTYVGTGVVRTIEVGFTPAVVLIVGTSNIVAMGHIDQPSPAQVPIVSGGFTLSTSIGVNGDGRTYHYLAIL